MWSSRGGHPWAESSRLSQCAVWGCSLQEGLQSGNCSWEFLLPCLPLGPDSCSWASLASALHAVQWQKLFILTLVSLINTCKALWDPWMKESVDRQNAFNGDCQIKVLWASSAIEELISSCQEPASPSRDRVLGMKVPVPGLSLLGQLCSRKSFPIHTS